VTPTVDTLDRIAGRKVDRSNAQALLAGLAARPLGSQARLAMYIGQMLHESANLKYDRELWGPTPAQKRYDTRTDLGNTAAADGDGKLYAGRTGTQITGRANYRAFRDWCRANIDPNAPDFEANPDLVLTDPWEGLGPIWFWETHGLDGYADAGNIEMVTRRINGGLNGFDDRCRCYVRAGLVLIGRDPDDVKGFQAAAGLRPDGVAGPATRAALHAALGRLAVPASPPPPAPASGAPAAPAARPAGFGALIASILAAITRRT
jgi:putative chitinase